MSTGAQTVKRRPRRRNDSLVEQVEIEFLVLADWAETINGKLYIQGGGWDRKLPAPAGQPVAIAIAAGFLVPWHLTNQEHQFSLTFETGDGDVVAPPLTGGFTMGRPAKTLPGQRLRTPFAATIGVNLPGTGSYQVRLNVNNGPSKLVAFYVVGEL
jgi:hypothetical protein